eukprot:7388300-Prymnesium_polylepis.3
MDGDRLLPEDRIMLKDSLECAELAKRFLETLSMVYKVQSTKFQPVLAVTSLLRRHRLRRDNGAPTAEQWGGLGSRRL